ncbi:hypothetical protein [Microbacterium sp. lyk4-40-TSB-66]|uniref:hypothetical protein n=1 Tax=Microbacterium sp. lyk4-40-TSB-66 TaxID=3040294 RepID=UPI00254FD98D|nr:hypothetical protein [Microbacterium sp. lyk4-40-TSB-66]
MRHTLEGRSAAAEPPTRRGVLRTAAWAVPAVALTATSPAYAVSGRTLSFSAASYAGVTCGTITDAAVRALDGTDALTGASVVLQLSDGYTFDGGATTATVVTDAGGSASCGTLHVPAGGATGTIAASAAGTTGATATLTSFDARLLTSPRGLTDASLVPTGAAPVALDLYLAAGALYRSGVGAVATGIASTGALVEAPEANGAFLLPVRLTDGSAAVFDTRAATVAPAVGTPTGATPVAGDLFLSGTSIYRSGVVLAADVDITGQFIEHDEGAGGTGRFLLPYRATDGTPRLLRVPDGDTRAAHEYGEADGPPAGAIPVADDLFIAGGDLYRVSWDGASPYGTGVVASGIASWGTLTPNPFYAGERLLPVVTTAGTAALFMVSGNAVRTTTAVPAGSTPLGADLFRVGSTVYQDAVGAVASDVTGVGQPAPESFGSSRVVVPLTSASSSC